MSRRTHELHSDICKRSKFKNDGLPDLTLVQACAPTDRSILANDLHAAGMFFVVQRAMSHEWQTFMQLVLHHRRPVRFM
jgi:hypothetical protein